jgi:hypothetical protein
MIPSAIVLYAFSAIVVIGARKLFRGPRRGIGFWIFMVVAAAATILGTLILAFAIYILLSPGFFKDVEP